MQVRQVAVLGAGTMGAKIAAHFANAGIPSLLMDLDPVRARQGLEAARKASPAAFFVEKGVALVETSSFDEGLPRLAKYDWVIEAVTENLEIKRSLWARVAESAHPAAVLSTNTSGIPLSAIAAGFAPGLQQRFLGTHFFNPPRYLHLLELIPGPGTRPDLLDQVARFAEVRLGKGVVRCKDTPNFIANRIGSFFGATVAKLMVEQNLSVEEVDLLTGPLIGLPKSASLRLLDVVGVDVWTFVSRNLYEMAADDPWRERFRVPAFLQQLLDRGWIGEKAAQGFYKRVGPKKEIHALDLATFDYAPAKKVKLAAVDEALLIEDLGERLRFLVRDTGKAGAFLKPLLDDLIAYAEAMAPAIAHAPEDVDNAMRWGYGHTFGPFEIRDALAGKPPAIVARGALVNKNPGASLVDLGDGVLQLEIHSKMNVLSEDFVQMVDAGLAELEQNFDAMVVSARGDLFSAGANLMTVLLAAQEEEWDELGAMVHHFQQMYMRLKYAPKPVIAAPHGRALGGGCELILHARGVQAQAELYMGLVEVGVGVIPAAGGCKEMIARLKDPRRCFELIGLAKVSTSAPHARELGLLDKAAGVTMNPHRLLNDAKALALAMTRSYQPGVPRTDIKVGGDPGYAALKQGAWLMRESGYISDHDFLIAQKLARILTGGAHPGEREVSEQHLLDLEREAFLSLCGTRATQERISHTLKTGKPLRN
ncbi:MAG: 3-hydroxyacyl-CoA dehydrogenase/enoyl-CoA hydratase family protein [Bryobacteraceae bacterium]|nr:3-hydroxyacyl-CoA dehydrogenase/enoyl-CoA hydratase family protein [Bryobacteraceae bacterium]